MWRSSSSRPGRDRFAAFSAGVAIGWVSLALAQGSVVKGVVIPLDRGLEGRARVQETVVQLAPESGAVSPGTPETQRVEVRHRSFVPRVVAVPVGSAVDFVNRDEHIHNVTSGSSAQEFDLGMTAPGETGRIVVDREGIVRILCKAEPPMDGYVVVVGTPWFGMAREDGGFEIRGLPPGTYVAEAWNPHYEAVRSRVPVHRDGDVVPIEFRFTKRR